MCVVRFSVPVHLAALVGAVANWKPEDTLQFASLENP